MHRCVVFNFGEFKSRKCSISFSRDYARKGQKNKKALKFKAFRGYIFFIALFWLRRWDFSLPSKVAYLLLWGIADTHTTTASRLSLRAGRRRVSFCAQCIALLQNSHFGRHRLQKRRTVAFLLH